MITLSLDAAKLSGLLARLSERARSGDLARVAASRYLELLRRHFRSSVANRHATANRLGATPTGYWANPTAYTRLQGNEITITKPGIRRALGPITLKPRRAKALTLPLSALAYGKRIADLRHTLNKPIFRPKGTRILAFREDDGSLRPLYALAAKASLPQDPSLLPPQETVHQALQDALESYLATLVR